MPGAMTDPQDRRVIAQWIASMKGDRTGEQFASDVTATTGWSVDRSRLSKYANGSIHIGRDVIAHLSRYAEAKGYPALDLHPEPEPSYEERMLAAINRQTEAIEAQTRVLSVLLAHAVAPDDRAALDSWVHAMLDSSSPRNPAHPVA